MPPARSCKKHHAGTTAGDLQTALPPCLAGDVGWKTAQHFPPQASSKFLPGQRGLICRPVDGLRVTHATDPFRNFQSARTPAPVRRPSGGAAQGDARHGRRARSEGTGTSLRDGPRSNAGGREVLRSKTRMPGGLLFGYFFLARQEKVTRPAGRKPSRQATRYPRDDPATFCRTGGPKPTQRAGDYSSLSRVIGRSLTRLPVAL